MLKSKKLVSGVLALTMVASLMVPVSAAEVQPQVEIKNIGYSLESDSVSEEFMQFIDSCFQSIKDVILVDADGNDVTEVSLSVIQEYYNNSDYIQIREYICNMGYSIGRISVKPSTRAWTRQNVDCAFYHIAEDSKYHLRKEWVTIVASTYTYDVNTYNISQADNPTIKLNKYTSFGYYFSPYIDDVSTQALISGGKGIVSFSGTYTMRAVVQYEFTGQNNASSFITIPVGEVLNFGSFQDSFAIYAGEEPEDKVASCVR